MLLRFGVSNHLSIRDFQELSLTASSLKDREEGLIPCPAAPRGTAVPAAAIYGANASGKSNFVNAIETMREMVLSSHSRGVPGGGVRRRPFRLDPACADLPSRFEIDFALDGARHSYGFEASDDAFESEWLYDFPGSRRRTLFEREGGAFRFGRALKGRNRVIADLTRPNGLYLSAAAQNGHERLSGVFEYFRSIRGVPDIDYSGAAVSAFLEGSALLEKKEQPDGRAVRFLDRIGTGVVGYRRKEEADGAHVVFELAHRDRNGSVHIGRRSDVVVFELAHRGRDGERVHFDLDSESAGTRRLLIVLELAFQALDEGSPLFVDELDASLHTQAAEAVLRLFCSPETNPKGAQLVATTHDTGLMRAPVLRRDQLWFAEKDDGGATRLFPLTDVRTRKGDDVRKGYLQGRYGAVPFDDPASALG